MVIKMRRRLNTKGYHNNKHCEFHTCNDKCTCKCHKNKQNNRLLK